MKKLLLVAVMAIAAMGVTAQDAKKGCNPKACKPGNTKVEEALVITNLRTKVLKLSEQVSAQEARQTDLIGKDEEESLDLISKEVSRLSGLLKQGDYQAAGSGATLVNQLSTYVDKLMMESNKNP